MPRPSPFTNLDFHEGLKLANKMGIEYYETPESKLKKKLEAADRIIEIVEAFIEPSNYYDTISFKDTIADKLKEYRKH